MTQIVNVNIIDFPNTKTSELITENDDGSYSIFLNAKMSHQRQVKAYRHALKHIEQTDFQKQNADKIELSTHSLNEE